MFKRKIILSVLLTVVIFLSLPTFLVYALNLRVFSALAYTPDNKFNQAYIYQISDLGDYTLADLEVNPIPQDDGSVGALLTRSGSLTDDAALVAAGEGKERLQEMTDGLVNAGCELAAHQSWQSNFEFFSGVCDQYQYLFLRNSADRWVVFLTQRGAEPLWQLISNWVWL